MQRQQWQKYEEAALDQVFGFDRVLHILDYKWDETNNKNECINICKYRWLYCNIIIFLADDYLLSI